MVYQSARSRLLIRRVHPHRYPLMFELKHEAHRVWWCRFIYCLAFAVRQQLAVVVADDLVWIERSCRQDAASSPGQVMHYLQSLPRLAST